MAGGGDWLFPMALPVGPGLTFYTLVGHYFNV